MQTDEPEPYSREWFERGAEQMHGPKEKRQRKTQRYIRALVRSAWRFMPIARALLNVAILR